MPQISLYNYKAVVTKVIDGDTVAVTVLLGLDLELKNQKLRLYGVNTPEMRGTSKEAAIAARDFLSNLVLNKEVILSTYKDKREKFGRYLATIRLSESDTSINQMLLDAGHAVPLIY